MQLLYKLSTKKRYLDILLVASLLSSLTTLADPQKNEAEWGIGVVTISQQTPYKRIDRNNMILPIPFFANEYVQFFGPEIALKLPSYNISDSQQLSFNLTGQLDFNGYGKDDIKDTATLSGMRERKGSIMAGGNIKWHNTVVDIGAEWVADVSGHSKGHRFNLSLEKTWFFGQHVMLTPSLAAVWQSKDYIDYYYGIRESEVRIGRAAHKGDSAINLELGARGIYIFDQKHSLFLDVKVTSLADEIKDSPIVDRSTQDSIMFGYMYRF